MNRTRLVLSTAVALVAATLAVPGSARADGDPAGTIVLASGPSTEPHSVSLQGMTPNSVLYSDERGLVVQRRDSSATVLLGQGFGTTAGPMVLDTDYSSGTPVQHWYNTATGRTGVTPTRWAAPAPTGGLITARLNPSTMRVSLQSAANGAVRKLADIAYSGNDYGLDVVSGADGVVISYDRSQSTTGSAFVGYLAYAGGGLRPVDLSAIPAADLDNFDCAAPNATTIACRTTSFNSDATDIFTAPLSGSAATVVAAADPFAYIALSAGAVGWTGYQDDGYVLRSVPIGGGATSTSAATLASNEIVSDGVTLAFEGGSSPADAGIYTASDATTTPTLAAALGAAPYLTRGLAIAPGGRVAFTDNRRTDGPLWQQSLTRTAGGVTAGGETLVVAGATGYSLSLSGARTGYGSAERDPRTYTVSSPLQPTRVTEQDDGMVSGNRSVSSDYSSTGGAQVTDLNTGAVTSTASFGDTAYYPLRALWGDYLVFAKNDGSVWRKNLATAAAATRVIPGVAGSSVYVLAAWGDRLAAYRYIPGSGTTSGTYDTTIVDTRAGTTRHDAGQLSGAAAAGYVLDGNTLRSWDGTNAVTVDGNSLVATASTMAWVGDDGRPRAAPVPWTTPDVPRSLGNPLAPATVASGGTWSFDLPTSAPLTACTVDLLRGTAVVRTLKCDATYTGGGDAVVQWDTKTANGRAAPTGTYKWRVNASNADGPLQLATGAAGTVSGTFTLTAAA